MAKPTPVKKTYSSKFSFAEMTSNTNGKTSGSGTAGLLIILIGALSFITGVILIVAGKDDHDVLIQSIAIIYAGAALLGVRKVRNTRPYYYENNELQLHDDGTGHGEAIYQSDEPR